MVHASFAIENTGNQTQEDCEANSRKIQSRYRSTGQEVFSATSHCTTRREETVCSQLGGIPLEWNTNVTLDEQPPKLYTGRTELEKRLLADLCERCAEYGRCRSTSHSSHERPVRIPRSEKPSWIRRMIALKRKTMPVCRLLSRGHPCRTPSEKTTD